MEREPCELVLTAPLTANLPELIDQLVTDRLCAAGHLDFITTTYRWQGQVERGIEARGRLHTCSDRAPQIKQVISEWHPYEVAYIEQRPLTVATEYAEWIRDETS
jgi:periplasmic divalent cation tolerance protein